ncbi:MAG: collagen-like protein, partial [Oscillibacter sp.]|nr:collagen-like protein [Oscillibacter sp.]
FYALMPSDNADSIAPGGTVCLPNSGPNSGGCITRTGPDCFQLEEAGIYLILFNAAVQDQGQMVLHLNDADLPVSVSGQMGSLNQISGISLVTAPAGAELSLRNPADSNSPLTLSKAEDGCGSLSAHLVIMQLSADASAHAAAG